MSNPNDVHPRIAQAHGIMLAVAYIIIIVLKVETVYPGCRHVNTWQFYVIRR
jgi:hypothetical protein